MRQEWRSGPISLDTIHETLVEAFPLLDATAQRAGAALYHLLAQGDPLPPDALAEKMGWPEGNAKQYLREGDLRSMVEWGGASGNLVVGYGGLTTRHSRHSLILDGRRLSTWCAWDALFIPEILGKPATVESVCPQSGNPVRLRVDGDQLERMVDREPVLSFKLPDPTNRFISSDQEILEFCNHVNLFTTRQAGTTWISTRPGTFLLSLADGFSLGKRYNEARYGVYLRGEPSPPHGNSQGEVA